MSPIASVTQRGEIGTVSLDSHEMTVEQAEHLYEAVRPLITASRIGFIEINGHAGCSRSPVSEAFVSALTDEVTSLGKVVCVLPGVCGPVATGGAAVA